MKSRPSGSFRHQNCPTVGLGGGDGEMTVATPLTVTVGGTINGVSIGCAKYGLATPCLLRRCGHPLLRGAVIVPEKKPALIAPPPELSDRGRCRCRRTDCCVGGRPGCPLRPCRAG